MGRAPCCDKANVKKGPWSPEEDAKLKEYINKNGTGGNWIALPHKVGLKRCGKSCRLRWLNYLRPNIKHGEFSPDEDRIICTLFSTIGSRWSIIAAQLPGRTDNDIKNYWNTKLKKKLMGINGAPQKKKPSHPNLLLPQSNPPTSFAPVHNLDVDQPSCSIVTSHGDRNLCFDGFIDNGVDYDQKLGCFSDNPQDYYTSIEEIKELICSSSSTNNLSFLMDEIKVEEKVWCNDHKIFKV